MSLNTPKPFTPQANRIGKDWQLWKKEFMVFLKLSGGYEKYSEENRALLLMNLMGTEGIRAMEKMTFNHPNEQKDMDILIMKFDEIFDPPLNEAEERFKFFSCRKRDNDTIENFVAYLKEKADTCNFGNQSEKFIIDMIIRNVDDYLREIIFALNNVTIPDLIQYFNQYSANTDKIKEISKKNLRNDESEESSDKKPQSRNCWRCNTQHMQRNCPAFGTICNVCNEKNHFSGRCKKEISQKRICSKCGTNHPYQQCPAYDYLCFKCHSKGHYENRCKNAHNTSTKSEVKNESTIQQSEQKNLLFCLWCDSKHYEGQCQHNPHCTRCAKFPHNICFNCKKNPHESSCYYKTVITLPKQTLKSSSDQKASSRAENKNHDNSSNGNSNYPKASNERPSTADPLLKDYVKINQNTARSAQYQASTSHSNRTKPSNDYINSMHSQYNHNMHSQYNHNKRNNRNDRNEKSDNCCIS